MASEIGKMHFRRMDELCALCDEVSSAPGYRAEPMEPFAPMMRRVRQKTWTPPS
jgi:hypothetical protein